MSAEDYIIRSKLIRLHFWEGWGLVHNIKQGSFNYLRLKIRGAVTL